MIITSLSAMRKDFNYFVISLLGNNRKYRYSFMFLQNYSEHKELTERFAFACPRDRALCFCLDSSEVGPHTRHHYRCWGGTDTTNHEEVIIWKLFLHYWFFVRGIYRWLVDFPHKVDRNAGFDVVVGLDKLLNKQLSWQWIKEPWCSYDVTVMWLASIKNTGFESTAVQNI